MNTEYILSAIKSEIEAALGHAPGAKGDNASMILKTDTKEGKATIFVPPYALIDDIDDVSAVTYANKIWLDMHAKAKRNQITFTMGGDKFTSADFQTIKNILEKSRNTNTTGQFREVKSGSTIGTSYTHTMPGIFIRSWLTAISPKIKPTLPKLSQLFYKAGCENFGSGHVSCKITEENGVETGTLHIHEQDFYAGHKTNAGINIKFRYMPCEQTKSAELLMIFPEQTQKILNEQNLLNDSALKNGQMVKYMGSSKEGASYALRGISIANAHQIIGALKLKEMHTVTLPVEYAP
jgi:hypothetical protein